jgi:HD superfamily phosphodiesterase
MSPTHSSEYVVNAADMAKQHMKDAFETEKARGEFMQAIKDTMASFKCPTHDFHHLVRVTNLAMLLAARSRQKGTAVAGAVVEVAALCHDVCDSKLVQGCKEDKVEALRVLLNTHTTFTPATCNAIVGIVTNIGYKVMIHPRHYSHPDSSHYPPTTAH